MPMQLDCRPSGRTWSRLSARSPAAAPNDRITVRGVDPRLQVWQDDNPRFEVEIWGAEDGNVQPSCDNLELAGPDLTVSDVLEWARGQTPAGGRYVVSLVVTDVPSDGRGLVRLDAGGSE